MPRLKKDHVNVRLESGEYVGTEIIIHVNTAGEFYCPVPTKLKDFFDSESNFVRKNRNGNLQIYRDSIEELKRTVGQGLEDHYAPTVVEEEVIRYNIESHVSFCIGLDGQTIYSNGRYAELAEGTYNWNDDRFGHHDACRPSRGGYSLTIGAKAFKKITYTRGSKFDIEFKNFGENDLDDDHPAALLNSWCSFTLPEDCREMHYCDEAALFFHDLMMGIAKLSKLIQDTTFDEKSLQKLIANNVKLIGN